MGNKVEQSLLPMAEKSCLLWMVSKAEIGLRDDFRDINDKKQVSGYGSLRGWQLETVLSIKGQARSHGTYTCNSGGELISLVILSAMVTGVLRN